MSEIPENILRQLEELRIKYADVMPDLEEPKPKCAKKLKANSCKFCNNYIRLFKCKYGGGYYYCALTDKEVKEWRSCGNWEPKEEDGTTSET